MTQTIGTRSGLGVLVGLVALQLTACGATIKPEGAAQTVADVVDREAGFRPTDVTCPSGVDAKVGGEFECHFTGPEGVAYTAHLKITKVDGERVEFDVNTFVT